MRTTTSSVAILNVMTLMLLLCSSSARGDDIPVTLSHESLEQPRSAWSLAAQKYDVDSLHLYAIAIKESRRRRPDGLVRPWPWTLHSPKSGSLYFETYEAALEKLTSLITEGATNIDVGLMQVNWASNGYRAADAKSLLLPAENIAVAAQVLRECLNEYDGDLRLAIACYHSPRMKRGIPYAVSVLAIVEQLRSATGVQLALAE